MAIYIKSGSGDCYELKTLFNEENAEKFYSEATPAGIINKFNLKDFDYNLTSKYGHFGFSEFPWEQ